MNSSFSGTFCCCFPTRPNNAFFKCFIRETLTINAMVKMSVDRNRYFLLFILLHGNANGYFV